MARPQSVNDQEIFEAARRVILRRGYDSFTLSEVAEEIGLTRGAIRARFESTEALKLRLTADLVESFVKQLNALTVECSGDGLLDFVAYIGQRTRNDREGMSSFYSLLRGNMRNPKLASLERKRGKAWLSAISARMPKTALSHDAAVRSFATLLTGAMLQLESRPKTSVAAYLLESAQDWLTLAKISHTKRGT